MSQFSSGVPAEKSGRAAASAPTAARSGENKKRKGTGRLIRILASLLGAVAIGVAAFLGGAYYFTEKRSIKAAVCAQQFSSDAVTVYRPPTGALDKFLPPSSNSLTVQIPVAPGVRIRDPKGKAVSSSTFTPSTGKEIPVLLTVDPKGQVSRIQELADPFRLQGPVEVKGKAEFLVGDKSCAAAGALLISPEGTTFRSGDDLEGYLDTGDVVSVLGAGSQAYLVEILAKAGRISVTTNVPGSSVYVDGVYRGKTPCVATASPGVHDVALKADGYVDGKVQVQVASLEETPVVVDLAQVTGILNVSTTPQGADVYVQGELKGQTPLRLSLVPGLYDVKVSKDGYYPRVSQATVVSEAEQLISIPLVRVSQETGNNGLPPLPSLLPGLPPFTSPGQSGSTTPADGQLIQRGKVLARDGSTIWVGDNWTECDLSSGTKCQGPAGECPLDSIGPGDTVSVYGTSSKDVRLVKVEASLGAKQPYEGNIVKTAEGYKVFGDQYVLQLDIPAGLEAVDVQGHAKDPLQKIPQGSRVRFYLGPSGSVVWAEYVWKAEASADGTLAAVNGALLKVSPQWQDLSISPGTVVYVGDRRSAFYDVKTGDSAVVAGPTAQDIRFVWVRSRALFESEVVAVVTSAQEKSGKVMYEFRDSSLTGYPYYLGNKTSLVDPGARASISGGDLQYGDRVHVKLDGNRQTTWGEVVLKNDSRLNGTYLGELDGYYYFDSFVKLKPSPDMIVVGLGPGESLEPGSRVFVASSGGVATYIEVQSEVTVSYFISGTVLSSQDKLRIRDGYSRRDYDIAQDARFVDWTMRRDGPLTDLFPGDKVTVGIGIGRPAEAQFAERTYSPSFKIEGTIEAIEDKTIVVADKSTRRTITLATGATIVKDGYGAGIWALSVGDKVKASGKDKSSVDVLVVGW